MAFFSRNSLHLRLAIPLFLGFIGLLGLASISIYFITKKVMEEDLDARLFSKAQAAIASISQKGPNLDVDWNELPQDLNPRKHSPDAIQLVDGQGHPFFKESPLGILSAPTSGSGEYRNRVLPALGNFRVLTLSFLPRVEEEDVSITPSGLLKPCLVTVAINRSSLDHSLQKLAAILTLATGGISLLVLALVWLVLQQGLRPLGELGAAVARIDAESLGQSISLESLPTELTPIVSRLNDLMHRLDVTFARERRFSADVSHELRTPVAELKTLSEVMLQEPDLTPNIQQSFLDARDIAVQMESLVTVLLEMVRQEETVASLVLTEVDLESLVRSSWKHHEAKAAAKKISFNVLRPAQPIPLRTEPQLLSLALSNLFTNAVEYSPAGSEIKVEFQENRKSVRLAISNPAANLTTADLPHLFERFWRKDKPRSGSGHFGLGLSLARMLCQRIDVALDASLEERNRVSFALQFSTPSKNKL